MVPSGEICGEERSGFPNSTFLGIKEVPVSAHVPRDGKRTIRITITIRTRLITTPPGKHRIVPTFGYEEQSQRVPS
jgi:hypothetical protein